MTKATRYAQARAIFSAALRWEPTARTDVVDALADGDSELADEVHSLLAHVAQARDASAQRGARAALLGPVDQAWTLAEVLRFAVERAASGAPHPAADDEDALWALPAAAVAAPEELDVTLGPAGPWTEVYALALIIGALLRGAPLAEGTTVAAVMARATEDEPEPVRQLRALALPRAVEAVLLRALARHPMDRVQSPAHLVAQLRDAAALAPPPKGQQQQRAATAAPTQRGRWRRAALVVAMAMAAAIALRAALGTSW